MFTGPTNSIRRRPTPDRMADGNGEFDIISALFAPLAGEGALGLTDDAALLRPAPGRDLVLAKDAMVHAVEGEREMIRALDHGWRNADCLKRITHEVRDLFRNPLQPEELAKCDAVVIDPPRAGAASQVAELAQSKVPRIAHVSCNPATFARDTATLIRAGYDLEWVKVVDQFRWSTHVELVALLRRNS